MGAWVRRPSRATPALLQLVVSARVLCLPLFGVRAAFARGDLCLRLYAALCMLVICPRCGCGGTCAPKRPVAFVEVQAAAMRSPL